MNIEYDKLLKKDLKESNNKREELQDLVENKDYSKLSCILKGTANDNYWIIEIVNNIFAPNTPLESKTQYFKKLEELEVDTIKYDRETLILKVDGEIFTFKNLCSKFREFKNSDYHKINYYDNNIYIPILMNKLKLLNSTGKIVIGYITEELLDAKKLRSWIEITKNNKTYAIDFVNNICMDQKQFYMFYKPNILNKVSDENIMDNTVLSALINEFNLKYDEYLIFAEEFNRDLQKKKGLLIK